MFGPSAARRDRWFSGIRWQVSLTWGLRWYEGLISHSGLAYEKYERPSASPPPSPTPSVYYKIITTKSRPGDGCWKNATAYANKTEQTQTEKTFHNIHCCSGENTHIYLYVLQRHFCLILVKNKNKSSWLWLSTFRYPLTRTAKNLQRLHARIPRHMS